MSGCTAPVRGHNSAAAAAACPACSSRSYRYGGGYRSSYGSDYSSPYSSASSGGGGSRSSGGAKPRWSRAGSSVLYTTSQVQSLTPIRESVEKTAVEQPELRDCFLCHAWDDRQGAAKQLYELLVAAGVKVWFSERELGLGVPMMRAIDKGLANSRIGLVLVTPNLLRRLPQEGVADKELSALLAGKPARAHRAPDDVPRAPKYQPLAGFPNWTGHCGRHNGGGRNEDCRAGRHLGLAGFLQANREFNTAGVCRLCVPRLRP